MDLRTLCDFCRERGVLAVQAHPFRMDDWIDHIRLYPNSEGVEIFNAGRNALCNDLSACYAKAYGKLSIGGSDLHRVEQEILSGMEFDEEVHSIEQMIRLLRGGQGRILRLRNQYLQGE
jgi:hypothetical protein